MIGIRYRAVVAFVAAGLITAACGGSVAPGSAGPTVTESQATAAALPTATATATAAPSPTPSPTVTPTVVTALPESDGHVYPGTYTTNFRPALTLTVGNEVDLTCVPGFKCRGDVFVNLPGWLNIGFGNVPGYELHVIRLDKVFDPKHPGKVIVPPHDLAAWIAKLRGVTLISAPQDVKIGGLDATQLDVQSGDTGVSIGPIPGMGDPGAGFGPHQAHRIIVLRVAGHAVLLMVGVLTDAPDDVVTPDDLKDATDFIQPLVDSIVWQ